VFRAIFSNHELRRRFRLLDRLVLWGHQSRHRSSTPSRCHANRTGGCWMHRWN